MAKFQSGKSGNPRGRPAGRLDRRNEFRDLIRNAVPELIAKALELARGGDTAALRMLLDRAIPPVKAEAQAVVLKFSPEASLADAGREILSEVASGATSPDVAKSLLEALCAQAKIVESDEIVQRIEALERRKGLSSGK